MLKIPQPTQSLVWRTSNSSQTSFPKPRPTSRSSRSKPESPQPEQTVLPAAKGHSINTWATEARIKLPTVQSTNPKIWMSTTLHPWALRYQLANLLATPLRKKPTAVCPWLQTKRMSILLHRRIKRINIVFGRMSLVRSMITRSLYEHHHITSTTILNLETRVTLVVGRIMRSISLRTHKTG
jgi:hypothetical protein